MNTIQFMQSIGFCSRRQFLARIGISAAAVAVTGRTGLSAPAVESDTPPVALFSKICQELDLDFDGTAEIIAESGLSGIDCPVRPGGQVLPARVADDLPRFADALARRHTKVLLLTTAIRNPASPHAESILRTARGLGVTYYRAGYWNYRPNTPQATVLGEIKAQLRDLAALNKEIGTCALLQNHAGADLVGAKLRDYHELVSELDPDQVAIAFDIGHALNELPQTWEAEFERLRRHVRVAYVKDWKRGDGFVPFGGGEIGATPFFKMFKTGVSRAPLSMHTEYAWDKGGRTKAGLIAALRRDLRVLKSWWAAA